MAVITVLGAGLVGKAIVYDLANSGHQVIAADKNQPAGLHPDAEFITADFESGSSVREVTAKADIVVGAAPGSIGFQLMEKVIGLGKNMVDISFCAEDYFQLDMLAREKNLVVIPDMGVAPGLCNLICGYENSLRDIDLYKCMVGGLPFRRTWPLQYKSSWSPIDCIEEYLRPARLKQNGREIIRDALSDLEVVEIEETGSLEEWNSDGLRSLLKTMPGIPNMVEKTLRYPGTTEYIKVLRDLGYFSYEEIEAGGSRVRPIDVSAALLFPKWKLEKDEKEFTIMLIYIHEQLEQGTRIIEYKVYDEYDEDSGFTSMSRTTGFSATAAVELLLQDHLNKQGICPPELVGSTPVAYEFMIAYLKERGIRISRKEEIVFTET